MLPSTQFVGGTSSITQRVLQRTSQFGLRAEEEMWHHRNCDVGISSGKLGTSEPLPPPWAKLGLRSNRPQTLHLPQPPYRKQHDKERGR